MSHISSLKSKEPKKEHIINKAIEFFSSNGFTSTRIDDITDALGIAKGTFYLYFKSKRELLIDCIGRLTTIVIPKEAWEDIRSETDYIRRHKKRLIAFLKAFPTFVGILNLIRLSVQSNDPDLVKKASDTYRMLANPLRKDFRWAIRHGVAREVDEEVISFLLWGMGEGIGYMLMMDPRYTIEDVAEIAVDFLSRGVLLSEAEKIDKSKTEHCYWDVTDSRGLRTCLRNVLFDEKDYVCGNLGNGELRVPLKDVNSILLNQDGNQMSAVLSLRGGEKVTLKIDGNISLFGESKFGQYTIALKDVTCISLTSINDASD
jgi:AcrR family transcriptional regulator